MHSSVVHPSAVLFCQEKTNTLAAPPFTRAIQHAHANSMLKHVNLLAVGTLVVPSPSFLFPGGTRITPKI